MNYTVPRSFRNWISHSRLTADFDDLEGLAGTPTVDDKKTCMSLRTLNYGSYGIFLILGSAGFRSSTVPDGHLVQTETSGSHEGSKFGRSWGV